MKLFFTLIFLLFNFIAQSQDNKVQNLLKELSNQFKTSEKTDDGAYTESIEFTLLHDTLYIYHSKGIAETYSLDEYHYFLKLNNINIVEYKEMTIMDIKTSLLSFSSKDDKLNLIFKYGTKEEATEALKEGSFYEDELQNNITISLPFIDNRDLYKQLEMLIKSLLK